MEDEADFVGAEAGFAVFAEFSDRVAVEQVVAGGSVVEETKDVKKSGFAATGRPHDDDEFALFDLQAEVVERASFGVTKAVAFGDVFEFYDCFVSRSHLNELYTESWDLWRSSRMCYEKRFCY